jgi:hypothetical protein
MFIYNVTIKVDSQIHAEWLRWMIEVHVPAIMQTKCFEKYHIAKLMDLDESEGMTFVFQYYAESKADYNRYVELHAPGLRKQVTDRWGDRFIAFRTLMEVVH